MILPSPRAATFISISLLIPVIPACTLNSEGLDFAGGSASTATTSPAGGGGDGGVGGVGVGGMGMGGGGVGGGQGGGAGAPPLCDGQPSDCADAVPGGWVRVGYAPDRATSCPSGFTEVDLTADPVLGADTCACDDDCQITIPPDCASGAVSTGVDDVTFMCEEPGLTLVNSPAGSCGKFFANGSGIYLAKHASITPPGPFGGACSVSATPDAAQVQWTEGRVCIPNVAACEFDLCSSPGAFAECILTEGDVGRQAPYSTKHALGRSHPDHVGGRAPAPVKAPGTGTLDVQPEGAPAPVGKAPGSRAERVPGFAFKTPEAGFFIQYTIISGPGP